MILAAVNYHRSGSAAPGARKKIKTPFLTKLLEALVGAMEANALKLQYLLPILAAVVSRLRLRVAPAPASGQMATIDPTGQGNTAAEELLLELIRDVGDLRVAKGFEHKDKVDEVVGAAFEVVGVEGVLKALPLNIEPDAYVPRPCGHTDASIADRIDPVRRPNPAALTSYPSSAHARPTTRSHTLRPTSDPCLSAYLAARWRRKKRAARPRRRFGKRSCRRSGTVSPASARCRGI
jgi:hypothetical protein